MQLRIEAVRCWFVNRMFGMRQATTLLTSSCLRPERSLGVPGVTKTIGRYWTGIASQFGQRPLTAHSGRTLLWRWTTTKSKYLRKEVLLYTNNNTSHSTLQVYYSAGTAALTAVTSAVSNDNSGNGQFQMGILKKPTGTSDVVNSGYQESGMHEGQIYGGLFVEDSANGCISTWQFRWWMKFVATRAL